MARTKKQKIEEISQVHGKVDAVPATLDQLLGDNGMDKYQTLDEKKYISQLEDMSKSEIQAHAVKMGLVPIDNRKMLEDRLLREFKNHVNAYIGRPNLKQEPISPEAMRILAEGR